MVSTPFISIRLAHPDAVAENVKPTNHSIILQPCPCFLRIISHDCTTASSIIFRGVIVYPAFSPESWLVHSTELMEPAHEPTNISNRNIGGTVGNNT